MKYVQFFHKSTGYIQGSIPPRFSESNVKPIELLGSDGVFILDGRNRLSTWIIDAENRMLRMKRLHSDILGYQIISAPRIGNCGRVVYQSF